MFLARTRGAIANIDSRRVRRFGCVRIGFSFMRRRLGLGWSSSLVVAMAAGLALPFAAAQADTLESALIQAYQNNPTLNSQRASVRAVDENVPQALSGYRPRFR